MLAVSQKIAGLDGVALLSVDSDGLDGVGGHAGAYADCGSRSRAMTLGLDADAALMTNSTHAYFSALGDLYAPGPLGLNVNDLRVIIVDVPND